MSVEFSICIPTYNRADLLRHALERLRALEGFGSQFEVVVSDNASTDDTSSVVEAMGRLMPYLRYCRQTKTVGPLANYLNAKMNATGEFVVYLADDDSIIPQSLMAHIGRMRSEPGLAAIYADWIAFDDARGRELHRYFSFSEPVTFRTGDPLRLVNFVLAHQVHPEIAVYRREFFIKAFRHVQHTYPFHLWMYRLSRLGDVAFDLTPFYRENRVLQKQFHRTHWVNMEMGLKFIGDELRNTLESMVLLAFQDAGFRQIPDDKANVARQMIDRFVHARLWLEIQRAVARKNWILAVELRQRLILWYGPGTDDEQARDVAELAVPAALQAIAETYLCLSGVDGLSLSGFQSTTVHDFFRNHYPDIMLVSSPAMEGSETARNPLVVFRDSSGGHDRQHNLNRGRYVLFCDQLLETYRVCSRVPNISGL